jgi:hypothetical protein
MKITRDSAIAEIPASVDGIDEITRQHVVGMSPRSIKIPRTISIEGIDEPTHGYIAG